MVKYIIQPGDTLYFIALKFGTSVFCIMDVNELSNPHSIYPGQVLNIPLFYRYSHIRGPTKLPILKKGDGGALVILAQTMLWRNAFASVNINGIYDSCTEQLVNRLQTNWRIPVTGNINEVTWKILLNDTTTYETPPHDCIMIKSGILLLLTIDKPMYKVDDCIVLSLVNMNLSSKSIELSYNSSQRYDFGVAYSNGRILWRWSDDKSFTQVTARVVLLPGQSVRYTEMFRLSRKIHGEELTVFARNTSKLTSHIRLQVKAKTTS